MNTNNTLVTTTYTQQSTTFCLGEYQGQLCLVDYLPRKSNISIAEVLRRQFTNVITKEPTELLSEACMQLDEYFAGKRQIFDLPIWYQGTPFQESVWQALMNIPYGETKSYGDIAMMIDNPNAIRAVGTAIGSNRLSIIIPCHRVLKSTGGIGGYAGGADYKAMLLDLEANATVTVQ